MEPPPLNAELDRLEFELLSILGRRIGGLIEHRLLCELRDAGRWRMGWR